MAWVYKIKSIISKLNIGDFITFAKFSFTLDWHARAAVTQDLQILVEWGILDASVSSYPVPWKGIRINKYFGDGDLFELVINRLTLNEDKQKPSPLLNGMSEELLRLSGFYQMHYGDWLVKLGATIEFGERDRDKDKDKERDSDEGGVKSDTDALVFAEIKYRLK